MKLITELLEQNRKETRADMMTILEPEVRHLSDEVQALKRPGKQDQKR